MRIATFKRFDVSPNPKLDPECRNAVVLTEGNFLVRDNNLDEFCRRYKIQKYAVMDMNTMTVLFTKKVEKAPFRRTHIAEAWVHPKAGGDDYSIEIDLQIPEGWTQEQIEERVRAILKRRGSSVLTDYVIRKA